MTNYEIQRLAQEVHAQLELDRMYAQQTVEAYEAQKERRFYEIVIDVVKRVYGFIREDIVIALIQRLQDMIR